MNKNMRLLLAVLFLLLVLPACNDGRSDRDDDDDFEIFLSVNDGKPVDEWVYDGTTDPDYKYKPRKKKFKEYGLWPRPLSSGMVDGFPDGWTLPGNKDPRSEWPIYFEEQTNITGFPHDETIKIVSANLKGFGPNKALTYLHPYRQPGFNKRRTISRMLSDYYKGMKPDVIAFQEVVGKNKNAISALAKDLAPLRLASKTSNPVRVMKSGNKEYNPIFYNPDELTLSQSGVQFFKKKINGQKRGVSWARFEIVDANNVVADDKKEFDFVVVSVHAPPPGANDAGRKLQTAFAENLFATCIAIGNKRDPDVILVGDFNSNPRGDAAHDKAFWSAIHNKKAKVRGKEVIFNTSVEFTNRKNSQGHLLGTSIVNTNVYDDIVWLSPTNQDHQAKNPSGKQPGKVIALGFDYLFMNEQKRVDKVHQNRVSDHKPVWAIFKKGSDESDDAKSVR